MEDQNNHMKYEKINSEESEVDLSMVVSIVKARWLWVVIAGGIGFLLAGLFIFHSPRRYTVNALIQVKAQNSTQSLIGKVGALATGLTQQASPADIQRALLHSRFILSTVVNDLNLNITVKPHTFPVLGRFFARYYTGKGLAPAHFGLSSYAWGRDAVSIKKLTVSTDLVGKKLLLVRVGPQQYNLLTTNGKLLVHGHFGQQMINNNHSVIVNINTMHSRIGEPFTVVVASMVGTIFDLSSRLTISDAGDQVNAQNTGVLKVSLVGIHPAKLPIVLNKIVVVGAQKNIEQNARDAAQSLVFINTQIPKIKAQLSEAELRLNQYQSTHGIIDIDAEGKMLLTQLGTQEQTLETAQLKKTDLLQSYTSDHPVIAGINDKIRGIEEQIQVTKSKMRHMPTTDQAALALMREVKIKEAVYTGLLEKSEQLAVIKAGTVGDISILDLSTDAQLLPSHMLAKIFGGVILGMIMAILILLARRLILKELLLPEEVEKLLGLSVQAILPYCHKIFHKNDPKASDALVAREFRDEPIVEAIRGLRTSLQLSLAIDHRKVIAVLGSSPGIGKTLLSTNLGLVFSDMGKKVLLIDTDMRRGQAKHVFNSASKKGLSDLLKGQASLDSVIHQVDEHLDVISSGTYTTKSNDLLHGPKFSEALDKLKEEYDYIIMDTPPILPVSDSLLVAKYADANVFLIGLGKNTPDEVKAAYNRFKTNHIDILFGVCNYCSKVAIKDASHAYGYYNYDYK